MAHAVVEFRTAVAGSGKTYSLVYELAHDFLPRESGKHWSNLPINVGALAEYCKPLGVDPRDVHSRVCSIPRDELRKWREGTSGPWEFFEGIDLQDALIVIDEVHNFCGSKSHKKLQADWQAWLGELRHRGARVILVSQQEHKIAVGLRKEAERQTLVINSELRRDPFLRIELGDWYQLRAKFLTGQYQNAVWVEEERKVGRRSVQEDRRIFWLKPEVFALYDSYSAPHTGGVKGEASKKEWERLGRVALLLWFVRRNTWRVSSRLAIVALLVWVCGFGGGTKIIRTVLGTVKSVTGRGDRPIKPKAQAVEWDKVPKATLTAADRAALAAKIAGRVPTRVPGAARAAVKEVLAGPVPLQPIAVPTPESLRMAELEAQLAALVEEKRLALAAVGVKLLSPDGVCIGGGILYRVGETIETGPYRGRKVSAILWRHRRAVLDDGTVLGLSDAERVREVEGADGTGVLESVPGSRKSAEAGVDAFGRGWQGNKPGVSPSASGGGGAGNRAGGGGLGGDRGGPGRAGNNPRSGSAAGGGGVRHGGPAAGGGSEPRGESILLRKPKT